MNTSRPSPAQTGGESGQPAGTVRARYWAAAQAASGVESEEVSGVETLADLLAELRRRHPEPRFRDVIGCCSVLVGDRPVGATEPAEVVLVDGQSVEFLPPFAGG